MGPLIVHGIAQQRSQPPIRPTGDWYLTFYISSGRVNVHERRLETRMEGGQCSLPPSSVAPPCWTQAFPSDTFLGTG